MRKANKILKMKKQLDTPQMHGKLLYAACEEITP